MSNDTANSSLSPSSSSSSSSSFHRSDPLDIPLIDNHILSHLLLPRIISSIKLAFPKVYLDWTTGTTATSQNNDNAESESSQIVSSLIKDSLFWKRLVENVLRLCLLLGSCRHIYNRNNSSGNNSDVQIKTPAMNSLGMFLQTTSSKGNSSRYQQYTKIFALTLTTIIIPTIYKELKIYRMKQLEEREYQLRFNEIRSELLGSRNSIIQQQQQQQDRSTSSQLSTLQNIIKQRAKQRQEYVISCITDCILGLSDIFIPPIRLINYLSYLWGIESCNSPQLGMRLVGWEYASSSVTGGGDSAEGGDTNGGQQQQQQHRHANFQYANRRLLVEEALRTVSMVIPPRRSIIDNNDTTTGTEDQQPNTSQLGNDRMNGNEERRRETRRGGWIRKRFLSFMGVTTDDDNNNTTTPSSITDTTTTVDGNERRYTLTCSMCHVDNPSIPYIASCGHCYCYICLRMAVTDDLSFRCLDCGQTIVSSSRVR